MIENLRRFPCFIGAGRLSLIALLAVLPSIIQAQSLPGWGEPVWQDEFTQADGSAPKSTNWGYDTGGGGWGNEELQVYTTSRNNSRIENNMLVIEAREPSSGNYTSARLLTKNKHSWAYGRMEARIKVPYGQGIWPAFWMLGANFPATSWPNCGEIDIMEYIGKEPQTVYGTVHGPGYSGENSYGGEKNLGVNLTDDFHVFAVEWQTNQIIWYVDDIPYHLAVPRFLNGPWVFDHDFFFILNVAVGGRWPGYPDGTTVFPQRMLVDYVRVYQAGNEPSPTGTNVLVNPGFESGTDGWNVNANGGTIGGATAYAKSGSQSLLIDSTGAGAWTSPQATQTFPAEEGDEFNFKGHILQPSDDPILDGSFGLLKIVFKDANGTDLLPASASIGLINADFPGIESLPVLNSASPKGSWVSSEAQGIAPAGTTSVTFFLLNVNQSTSPSGIHWDDMEARLLGEPVLPFSLRATLAGGNIQISFPTQNGVNYDVVYKNSLTDPTWQLVETITGDGTTNTVSYPTSDPARAYAVQTP